MLSKLHIQNFALIENETIDFCEKLVILSGETGSGKSIVIGAINFLMGERADKSLVRYGCDTALVEGVFLNVCEEVKRRCRDFGIDASDEIIISRKLTADGKSEIRLNGVLVTLSMLKSITLLLVDIYGQHQHQSLLDESSHINFIDAYDEIFELKELENIVLQIKQIDSQMKIFGGDEISRVRERDILEFELKELEEANLELCEDEILEEKKKKFSNVKKIAEAIDGATSYLGEDDNGSSVGICLYNANKLLDNVSDVDDKIQSLSERLSSVKIEIEDIKESLTGVLDDYDFSEQEFMQIESRLEILKNIKRKYGGSVQSAIQYMEDAKQKLEFLNNSEEKLKSLQQEKQILTDKGWDISRKITEHRKSNARKIEGNIEKELSALGMASAKLVVDFKQQEMFSANGADLVEFLFSANVGEPLKPLIKVISGGEMSRFMLAFKSVMGKLNGVQTMIFNEIDNGIGGEVGFAVACKLVQISRNVQVIVVTHLASIGAMADQHFQIKKKTEGGRTFTKISKLNTNEQLAEIARLAGGFNGAYSKEYANELKIRANQLKA